VDRVHDRRGPVMYPEGLRSNRGHPSVSERRQTSMTCAPPEKKLYAVVPWPTVTSARWCTWNWQTQPRRSEPRASERRARARERDGGKKERWGAHQGGSSRSGAIAGVHWSSLIRLSSALGTKLRGREGSALYRRHGESDHGVRDCSEGSGVD
jgi:hypothetical protein